MKYKGDIKDFPEEVVEKMLERQVEQGNKRDVNVFEQSKRSSRSGGGFFWGGTEKKDKFWDLVIVHKNFDLFFERYPKNEFAWGEEIEVSDDGERWKTKMFVGLNPVSEEFKYVCVCLDQEYQRLGGVYKYARKIQQKQIPEYTVAELQEKLGHEFKIKK